jgi:hypothetical protein
MERGDPELSTKTCGSCSLVCVRERESCNPAMDRGGSQAGPGAAALDKSPAGAPGPGRDKLLLLSNCPIVYAAGMPMATTII